MTGHTPQKLPFFQRNLLHHRSALGRLCLHALDYLNTHGAVCQLFFAKIFQFFLSIFKGFSCFSGVESCLLEKDVRKKGRVNDPPLRFGCLRWEQAPALHCNVYIAVYGIQAPDLSK